MTKLRLTLDKQATPIDDIKPRQENAELTEALIDLATELDDQFRSQKEKKMIKYPLNNLPEDIKPKSVSSKIYGLRVVGKLPLAILPKTRTIKDPETGKKREVVYMVRVTDDVAKRFEDREKARTRKER